MQWIFLTYVTWKWRSTSWTILLTFVTCFLLLVTCHLINECEKAFLSWTVSQQLPKKRTFISLTLRKTSTTCDIADGVRRVCFSPTCKLMPKAKFPSSAVLELYKIERHSGNLTLEIKAKDIYGIVEVPRQISIIDIKSCQKYDSKFCRYVWLQKQCISEYLTLKMKFFDNLAFNW